MNKSKFTPGPWKAVPYSYNVESFANGVSVCSCDCIGYTEEQKKANACLIAVTPEMYNVLYSCCEVEHSFSRCKYRPESCTNCPIKAILERVEGAE